MAFRNRALNKVDPVQLAIKAILEGNIHPLDLDVDDVDLSLTSLDIPTEPDRSRRSHSRFICADCGRRLGRNPRP
jgi:hypothetical protein